MPVLPEENAISHLRNVLQAFAQPAHHRSGIFFTVPEAAAICVRLRKVLAELETYPMGVAERRSGLHRGPTGFAERNDDIRLRAVGDHVERVYPPTLRVDMTHEEFEAGSGASDGEDYGSPILPPAQQDGAAFRGQESE